VCLKGFLTFGLVFFQLVLGPRLLLKLQISTPSMSEPKNIPLIKPHVLTIGSYTNYPPQEYLNAEGLPVGFDIDLIDAISDHLSVRPEVVSDSFPSLINDLLAKRFDVVISAVSINSELQQQVDFVPYFRGGESLLVAQGNPLQIHTLSDLCGKAVAVSKGSSEQQELLHTSNMCRQAQKSAIIVVIVDQYIDAVHLFQSKRVVAAYEDSSIVDYCIKLYPELFALGGAVIGVTMEGIALRKDDPAMLAALNLALSSLESDGTYRVLINRWGLYRGDVTVPANYKLSYSCNVPLDSKLFGQCRR
jgi:polar amino acid transport system substrate-binding protein